MEKKKLNIAVVGATGVVGEELLIILEEALAQRDASFSLGELYLLASARSAGEFVEFRGEEYEVEELTSAYFANHSVDVAFFLAGGSISEVYAPIAAKHGALVIDNTSHFRMDADIPLIVPYVNSHALTKAALARSIIANPNCSTIQMVYALAPLLAVRGIERVDVATYQAVSGAGKEGMKELVGQIADTFTFTDDDSLKVEVFPYKIAFNLIPQIDVFMDNAYTKEEMKMINETNKIFGTKMAISATCVRVPITRSHSEDICVSFDAPLSAKEARELFYKCPYIELVDDIKGLKYPMPIIANDTDMTYVGRVRDDLFDPKKLHLFVVADQLRVGAALNAVNILKEVLALGLL